MTGRVGIQRHHVKQRRRVVLGAEGGQREIGAATCPGAGRGKRGGEGGRPPCRHAARATAQPKRPPTNERGCTRSLSEELCLNPKP